MRKNKKNEKGITLISLAITIVVLLLLTSIATYSGIGVIKSSNLTTFTTEMKIMQTQVNKLYENNKDSMGTIGKDININSDVKTQADEIFTEKASGITDQTGYRYFDQETIKNLKIEGVESEFFVNIEKRSVVSYMGLEYEEKTYYTLEQLPNGLYNVEYENKNIGQPTFDTNIEKLSEGNWKITISNIQYSGYINKWEIQYQKEGETYWNTSEELSFIVTQIGNYTVQIKNGNVIGEATIEINNET